MSDHLPQNSPDKVLPLESHKDVQAGGHDGITNFVAGVWSSPTPAAAALPVNAELAFAQSPAVKEAPNQVASPAIAIKPGQAQTSPAFIDEAVNGADKKAMRQAIPLPGELEGSKANAAQVAAYETDQIKQIKHLINSTGKDPTALLSEAASHSRVVAVGDVHYEGNYAHLYPYPDDARKWLGNSMKMLSEANVTYLAFEGPQGLSPIFESFNNSPKGSGFVIPKDLPPGIPPRQLAWLRSLIDDPSEGEMIKLWCKAHDAGIKVVPVDNDANPDLHDLSATNRQLIAHRDNDMKRNIMHLLDPKSNNKVVLLLGNGHLGNAHGASSTKTVVEQIADQFETRRKGETITTFVSMPPWVRLSTIALDIELVKPVAVSTHDGAKSNAFGNLALWAHPDEISPEARWTLNNFDYAVLFTVDKSKVEAISHSLVTNRPEKH